MSDAMKSLSLKDASTFYKMPCARDSLMLGIGAGFGVGGVRGVLGGMFSSFFLSSFLSLSIYSSCCSSFAPLLHFDF